MSAYVVLDIEANLLDIDLAVPREIAALRFDEEGPPTAFQRLLRFAEPSVSDEEFGIHGISQAMIDAEGVPPAQALADFAEFCGDAAWVGHNVLFYDCLVLARHFKDHGIAARPSRVLDTLPLAREHLVSPGGRFSLGHLCQTFGIINDQAHRAASDVAATAQIFELILAKEASHDRLWELCGSRTFDTILELPARFRAIQEAITAGREICIEYESSSSGSRERWVKPLRPAQARVASAAFTAICLESGTEKMFRLDRIKRVVGTRGA